MKAQEVLERYWSSRLPIDPTAIARAMGVEVVPDSELEYDGHYQIDPATRTPRIYFNADAPVVRQRFTIAHELGHHARGDLDAPRDTRNNLNTRVNDPREIGANRFAAALLMPQAQVEIAVFRRGITSISRLASLFDVSEVAMEYRLQNLGLL